MRRCARSAARSTAHSTARTTTHPPHSHARSESRRALARLPRLRNTCNVHSGCALPICRSVVPDSRVSRVVRHIWYGATGARGGYRWDFDSFTAKTKICVKSCRGCPYTVGTIPNGCPAVFYDACGVFGALTAVSGGVIKIKKNTIPPLTPPREPRPEPHLRRERPVGGRRRVGRL